MRVLVADKLPEMSLVEMRALGVDVEYRPDLTAEELPGALADVGVLVVRGTPVEEPAIAAGRSLNLIIRAGAGVAAIDVGAASQRGIFVCNCPGRNAAAVAELTMTLIGCLDRRVPDAVGALREGRWQKHEFAKARGLRGRRIGIAGLGHVGRSVAKLARAFGMLPRGWSRSLTIGRARELGVGHHDDLVSLARDSDILTLHADLNDRTRGMVNADVLEALPSGAFLINTARAELVDWEALVEIAPKKSLRLGLDVLPDEPDERRADYEHPILKSGVVYATPHIGASTDEAQAALGDETVRILRSFLMEDVVVNAVNVAAASPAKYQLIVRTRDKVGVLANVLAVLKRHGISVLELENTVFHGAKAGCAKIRTDVRPSDGCISEILAFSEEVLNVDVVTLPNMA